MTAVAKAQAAWDKALKARDKAREVLAKYEEHLSSCSARLSKAAAEEAVREFAARKIADKPKRKAKPKKEVDLLTIPGFLRRPQTETEEDPKP